LSVGSLVRSAYLSYLSQPAADRPLWKAIKSRPIRSIVELGVSLGGRTERVLEVAAWRRDCLPLAYCGIDLFDARPGDQPRLPLKQAFHDLRATGATIRLVPGEPAAALSRTANALTGTDLLLIAAGQSAESLAEAWRFVPRMIHAKTLIFVQGADAGTGREIWQQLTTPEVEKLAVQAGRGRRRAA
jgi:hypothetical protein